MNHSLGEGEGADMLTATASRSSDIDSGMPILENVESYKDISREDTLNAHTREDLAAKHAPIIVPSITVRGDQDPTIGAYVPGDEAFFHFFDTRFPGGANWIGRITAFAIKPREIGQPETVTLTLGDSV